MVSNLKTRLISNYYSSFEQAKKGIPLHVGSIALLSI